MPEPLVEPWLRGAIPGVDPHLTPILYSLQMAREDLAGWTEPLTDAQIWARPHGVTPIGFQLKHIAGSIDRLLTCLLGRPLDETQTAALKAETEPGNERKEVLLAWVNESLAQAEEGGPAEVPSAARFHTTPDNRLFVVYYVNGRSSSKQAASENRLLEIFPDGAVGWPVPVPLRHPLSSYFTATVRAGPSPSFNLDLPGHRAGQPLTLSYARIRLSAQPRRSQRRPGRRIGKPSHQHTAALRPRLRVRRVSPPDPSRGRCWDS